MRSLPPHDLKVTPAPVAVPVRECTSTKCSAPASDPPTMVGFEPVGSTMATERMLCGRTRDDRDRIRRDNTQREICECTIMKYRLDD